MDDDDRWTAVLERDDTARGFFYGVMTTGIYCRPSCPSRRPRRENTRFFGSGDAALAAGLRPCRRCRPEQSEARHVHAGAVERACRRLERSDGAVTLAELADDASLSPSAFRRAFTELTGVSPAVYARGARARRASEALAAGDSVTDAIHGAGYGSSSRFYDTSTARLGMRPSEVRTGGDGIGVRFAVAESSLGPLLVAASDRGVCAIEFGDDPEQLVADLQSRFHSAELCGDDPDFDHLVATVVALVERPDRAADLPLDIRGTSFQERVWAVLRQIPPGTTLTYAEVAERIGSPAAVRAVGTACGANHLAVAVPCHRVVRRDGALSGYRWGVDRKAELLHRERAQS